ACMSLTKTKTKSICAHQKNSSTTTCCSEKARLLLLGHSPIASALQKTSMQLKRSTKKLAAAPNAAKTVSYAVSRTPCALNTHWVCLTSSCTTLNMWNAQLSAPTCTYPVHWYV